MYLASTYILYFLTFCILVSSADNLLKQFRPRSAPTYRPTWSGSNLLDTLMVVLKEFFKKFILKKKSATPKKCKNYTQ